MYAETDFNRSIPVTSRFRAVRNAERRRKRSRVGNTNEADGINISQTLSSKMESGKTVAFQSRSEDDSPEDTKKDGSEDEDSGRSYEGPLFPALYPVVLLSLKQTSVPRIWCLRMVANPWFERVSMLVILINCVTLGLYQPCQHRTGLHCESERCMVLEMFDHFVFAFFALEMLIKMLAMGVWGKLGYLGEAWNRLDFFIVLCGMLEYTLQMEDTMNFTSVRTVRVLRPLRAINRVPNMRILVMLLLDTLPMLGNVLMLCSFVFFIFGVVAVQLWEGTLRQRCFLDPHVFNITGDMVTLKHSNISINLPPYFTLDDSDDEVAICSLPIDNGDFKCMDRNIITPNKVNNVTCSLNISSFIPGQAMDHIYTDLTGATNCIDWNQYFNTCKAGDQNPYLGSINFDNIMYAWVAIFQVISLEGWVDIMYYLMDGYSFYSFIYFILLIVIGSFFMINLCLVVIATQFSETKQREQRLIEEQRLRFKSNDSTLASYSPPGNCYEEMLKYISHLYRRNKRKIRKRWNKWKLKKKMNESVEIKRESSTCQSKKKKKSIHLHHHHHHHHHHYHISETLDRTEGIIRTLEKQDNTVDTVSEPRARTPQNYPSILPQRLMVTDGTSEIGDPIKTGYKLTVPIPTPGLSTSLHSVSGSGVGQRSPSLCSDRRPSAEINVNPGSVYFKRSTLDCGFPTERFCTGVRIHDDIIVANPVEVLGKTSPCPQSFVTSELNCSCAEYEVNPCIFEPTAEVEVENTSRFRRCLCCCGSSQNEEDKENSESILSKFQTQTKVVVDSNYFNRGIMVAILINTLSMGIEHHNQPTGLTEVLEISNVVFTTLFALEMLSKIVAYGFAGYIKNLYNVFDALIVIISVWEIAAGTQNSGGGLSVLRTFRLLRVLKLVRFMPALQRQLVVLMKTMDNVATFMMLLTLFIFIFSILGMHLFGCDFCWVNQHGRTECDRKNFDSLLWAFVTVFQILTQEDWNIVLYNGMAATSPFAAIYFVTLMTIGNYVLFSLLVAILVEGFQAECYSTEAENQTSQDEEDSDAEEPAILAENYTKRVAKALGITGPIAGKSMSPKIKEKKKTAPHDGGDNLLEDTSSSSDDDEEVELLTRSSNPRIKITSSKDDILSANSSFSETTGENRLLPVITRTAATPLHTPTLHSPIQRHEIEKSFMEKTVENQTLKSGSSTESEGHSGQLNKKHSLLSRKSSTESCLSVSSVIKFAGGSPISRTGSWRLRRFKGLPLDRQSLVCSEEEDQDNEIEDDMYSNASFENEPEQEIEIKTPNVITESQDSSEIESTYSPINNNNNNNINIEQDTHSNSKADMQLKETDSNSASSNKSRCNCIRSCKCPSIRRRSPDWVQRKKDWSLYLFSPELKFRKAVQKITEHKLFDYMILLLIFGNCITIALERPSLKEEDHERKVIDGFNNVFTFVFLLELILKVIASGFYIGHKAYLKSGWNVLDFFLVASSLIDVIMTLTYSSGSKLLGILRVFRLLRALRPLRVISRAPGLKLVVQTLISSLKPIGNIVLICCAFFLIFGILGVQVLKGKFYYCDGPDLRNVTNKTDCLLSSNNQWVNRRYNFDDVGQALMSLFVISSKDGWVEIMYHGIDATGIDQQPIRNSNPWMLLYFVSFLLIVGFFVLNMFVGVVVENFHRCREEHELEEQKRREERRKRKQERLDYKRSMRNQRGDKYLTFRRKTLSKAKNHVTGVRGRCTNCWRKITTFFCGSPSFQANTKYYEDYGRTRRALHAFCLNKYFEIGVSIVIGINIFTMAAEHYQQPKVLDQALKIANYFFTAVFVLEAILKLIALGVRRYFRDKWNQVDMIIVILSLVGIAVEALMSAGDRSLLINPTIIRVMRVLRIARVLKLLKVSKGIRSLLETVANALPQVGNLGLLFLLLFFIFAALGVELFGTLSCDELHPCNGLSRHASFSNFGIALLTLFRISTGDNWNGIMKDVMKRPLSGPLYNDTIRETCDSSDACVTNCCGSSIISPIYFVLFVMTAQFVLVNVVVAVLMKQLEDNRAEDDEEDEVFEDDSNNFTDNDDQVIIVPETVDRDCRSNATGPVEVLIDTHTHKADDDIVSPSICEVKQSRVNSAPRKLVKQQKIDLADSTEHSLHWTPTETPEEMTTKSLVKHVLDDPNFVTLAQSMPCLRPTPIHTRQLLPLTTHFSGCRSVEVTPQQSPNFRVQRKESVFILPQSTFTSQTNGYVRADSVTSLTSSVHISMTSPRNDVKPSTPNCDTTPPRTSTITQSGKNTFFDDVTPSRSVGDAISESFDNVTKPQRPSDVTIYKNDEKPSGNTPVSRTTICDNPSVTSKVDDVTHCDVINKPRWPPSQQGASPKSTLQSCGKRHLVRTFSFNPNLLRHNDVTQPTIYATSSIDDVRKSYSDS
uniref:voltage-dependent T-type calcium channel subunit alpha-1G isoform X3 n=1 Tax=Ciona intestinalis TaxID=7719 RepID=UPI000EF5129B|nr:voltage-dependent T-type calcium channel subunit alpha-1G isoform X3 [Ciona intestinalis]|eukprot:XP_026690675.1 voltage-dependent T-type calcium channel subunit alpha-1G isoform X3 [Ciona intestinalis]